MKAFINGFGKLPEQASDFKIQWTSLIAIALGPEILYNYNQR